MKFQRLLKGFGQFSKDKFLNFSGGGLRERLKYNGFRRFEPGQTLAAKAD